MATPEEAAYEAFLERVQRTVYMDELTPHATDSVIRSALDQFGTVKQVSFLTNYLDPMELPVGVLVEMESQEKAQAVIETVSQFPFMVAGIPRPVRASAAMPEMFEDRPQKPGRVIQCRWIEQEDPDLDKVEQMKRLVGKHAAEASYMLKKQLEEAEKLANEQSETARTHHRKFEMIDKLLNDGVAQNLADNYNMRSFPGR